VRGIPPRYQSHVFTIALIMAIILLVIGAIRNNYLSIATLAANKDAISAVSSIATMCLVVVGAIASYHRFFRGRTFSVRADLSIDAEIIQAPDDSLLHAVTVVVKNVGSTPIWHPEPTLSFDSYHGKKRTRVVVDNWLDEPVPNDDPSAGVIEPGETVCFFATHFVPANVWAVGYVARIKADSGDIWFRARTFPNRPSKPAADAT
jgi:hypothetical protein